MIRIGVFDAETGIKIFDCLAEQNELQAFRPPEDPALPFLADVFDAIRNEFPGSRRGFLSVSRNGKRQEIWWEIEPLSGKKIQPGSRGKVARAPRLNPLGELS